MTTIRIEGQASTADILAAEQGLNELGSSYGDVELVPDAPSLSLAEVVLSAVAVIIAAAALIHDVTVSRREQASRTHLEDDPASIAAEIERNVNLRSPDQQVRIAVMPATKPDVLHVRIAAFGSTAEIIIPASSDSFIVEIRAVADNEY